jgi:hypothetical protein
MVLEGFNAGEINAKEAHAKIPIPILEYNFIL